MESAFTKESYYDIDLLKLGYEGEKGITQELFNKYGRTYQEKQIIIREGDHGSEVYLIVSGRVVVCEKLKAGSYKVLASLGPGEIFGEMAALEETPRSATLISASNVKVLAFSREDFAFLFQSNPRWAFKLLGALAKRVLNTFEHIKEHYNNRK